jgi:WD40 repeat protein
MKIGWLLYNLMRALAILILLLSLGQLTSSWCLKTTVNLTNEVTIIDYSPDGTLIAATSSTNNAVYIYDTTNFLLQYTYNPPGGTTVQTARFTANNTYLGVGLSNGNVLIIPGKAPFSSTAAYTITTQNNKNVADLDFNAGGTQMVVCLSNWNSFFVITNYASATPTSSSLSIGSGANGCKFSLNNDVAIIDNSKNAFTYTIPANGNIGALNFISKVTNPGGGGAPAYVDLDIRRTTAVPIKIILSGGGTSQQSAYYFMNTGTGTTVTASTEAFINAPSNTVAGACYSPDNLEYAFASADTSLWVFS